MEKVIFKLKNTEENQEKLLQYLETIDSEFVIPLSEKVKLSDYAKKILSQGIVLATLSNGEISSMLGAYCNDMVNRVSYVPILTISKQAQTAGFHTRDYLRPLIELLYEAGMEKFYCQTANRTVAAIYKRLGFTVLYQDEINGVPHWHLEMGNFKNWLISHKDEHKITVLEI